MQVLTFVDPMPIKKLEILHKNENSNAELTLSVSVHPPNESNCEKVVIQATRILPNPAIRSHYTTNFSLIMNGKNYL